MSVVLSVRVPKSIDEDLIELSRKLKRSKSEVLKDIIKLGIESLKRNLIRTKMLGDLVEKLMERNVRIKIRGGLSIVDIVSRERE